MIIDTGVFSGLVAMSITKEDGEMVNKYGRGRIMAKLAELMRNLYKNGQMRITRIASDGRSN